VWLEATTLRAAGYEVSIISPLGQDATAPYEQLDGIHVYRHAVAHEAHNAVGYLLEYGSALFHELRLAIKIARRHGFDVIHACNPPDLIFLVGLFFKPFGKHFIFDHHDLNPELYVAKFGEKTIVSRIVQKVLLWCERITFSVATISIATNESYRQIAVKRGRKNPENVFVVRSGPNLRKIKRMPPDKKWRNGRAHLVGYVGVIGQQEGLDLLLLSLEHIVRRHGRNDVQFVVVGDGPELPNIKELAKQRQLNEFVTFTGRVDDTTLLTVLSTADVCVNPDRFNAMNDKSTMNKILEYMALERPIVQFDLVEGRVSAQHASLYATRNDPLDFADKILELLSDPQQRAAMGRYGRERVEKELSWEHEVPHLLAAYDTLFSMENEKHRRASDGSQRKSAYVGSASLDPVRWPRNTNR
jgi:glycosyltransferase involved in cell wall biosynthesis